MADIETTLKTRTNQDNVFPNIHTANIPDGGVTTNKIANGGVTTSKLENGAVTYVKIADNAVIESKIMNGAVTNAKLAMNSVSTLKIMDGAVTHDKLSSDCVDTDNIQDGATTGVKIATSAIGLSKLNIQSKTLLELYDLSGSSSQFIVNIVKILRSPFSNFIKEASAGPDTVYLPVRVMGIPSGTQSLEFLILNWDYTEEQFSYALGQPSSTLPNIIVTYLDGII